MKTKRLSMVCCLFAVFMFSVAANVSAIDFPVKPINLVIGFAAGGSTDIIVRAITDKMSEKLGVPVIVVNKPGSAGVIGAEYVARAKPDGYNILVFSLSHLLRQTVDPKVPYDVLKDFEPICMYVSQPAFIVTNVTSQFNTIDNMIDFAKKNPGKLSLGSAGIGAVSHFSEEMFKMATKIEYKHVPFQGEAPALTALMGGHIDGTSSTLAVFFGKIASGDIRALASFDENRAPELKEVPTLKEMGYPEAVMYSWFSFAAPAGTPKGIVEKLDNGFRGAIKDPASKAAIERLFFRESYKGPTEFAQFIKSEYRKFEKIAKEGAITLK